MIRRLAKILRVDRASVLILAIGAGAIALSLFVLGSTLSETRDHTRSLLVTQQVGRSLTVATISLTDAARSGVVWDRRAIDEAIDRAQAVARDGVTGDADGDAALGRLDDAATRAALTRLARDIGAWRRRVDVALATDGSVAQRAAAAREGEALRDRNTALSALVASAARRAEDRVALLRGGLVAVLAFAFGALAWQVGRSRRALRAANERLRVRVEERTAQLTASETRMRAVLDSSLDGIVVMDADGVVQEWNPRMEELVGVSREEAVGRRPPADRIPAIVRARQLEGQLRYAETGDPRVFDARVEDVVPGPDGQPVPVEFSITGARNEDELTISHVVRDIAERLRTHREIEDARDAAEAAGVAKSAFLATMSHEIRTPMNAIVGMTGLLRDTPLTPEQREYAETVRTSGEQLLAIINDILDFSKIESGKLDLERHPFALREVIESALDLLAPQAAAKELDLGYLLETDGSTQLIGDSTRLRQVLINLLANAVKFTSAGSVTVHGVLTGAGDDRARLRLEVRDTGIGIPPDRIFHLFESFSQVDASTTRQYGGTGLGLAISKRLVEAMDGAIAVSSVPGRGSTFAIDVELARLPGPDPVSADVPETLRGRRVLAVDDNDVNRRLLERQLAAWEMDVVALERPADAIALVRAGEAFDIAIVDMAMPEMNGLALADALAEATGYALPIMLLSSLGGVDPDVARGRLAATLSKPVKPATLRSALAGALSGETAGDGAGDAAGALGAGPGAGGGGLADDRLAAGAGVAAGGVGGGFAGAVPGDAAAAVDATGEFPAIDPVRVLVAEDNAVNQRVAIATLERLGHRAEVAGDGREAVDAVHRQAFDLVLMDVQMPQLDGLEATRRIRAELPPERQPRIVAMTANAFTEDREACMAAGMDDYLTKPVAREQLVRVLADASQVARDGTARAVQLDPASALPTLDRDRFEESSGGDPEIAAMLAGLHAQESRPLLKRLRAGAADGDLGELQAAAHTLGSASASVGAVALAALCRELELAARADVVGDAVGAVEQIAQELARVRIALSRATA